MILEWMLEPTALVGLFTLIVIEVVLGIDNLVFIAILADRLPPHQRDKARLTGLSLALLMRLGLLAAISWMVTLTQPFISIAGRGFSARDIIMLAGGAFLLFKATMELHDRLEGGGHEGGGRSRMHASFWPVIAQIVVLDAVFSIDSVITAIGMVHELQIMMIAVIVAVIIMMIASKPLTRFVNAHPTVVILCLGFLLMIGFSLVAEGFGFPIPKGYLYAAIGFSVLIEAFNQTARFNRRRFFAGTRPLRERTAEAVLRILGGQAESGTVGDDIADMVAQEAQPQPLFDASERAVIRGVLNLAERSVRTVMTPRRDVEWINIEDGDKDILAEICASPYSRIVAVSGNDIDNPIGIIRKKDLLAVVAKRRKPAWGEIIKDAPFLPESVSVLDAVEQLRAQKAHMAFIVDEYGTFEGLLTVTDILEAIAGDMPEEDSEEDPMVQALEDGGFLIDGRLDYPSLQQATGFATDERRDEEGEFHTAAGLVMHLMAAVPEEGQEIEHNGWRIRVVAMDGSRIDKILFTRLD